MPSSQDHEAALFALAVRKPVSERESFLQAVCGSDEPLRQRLDALLAAHDQPAGVLNDEPAREVLAPTLDLPEPVADETVGMTLAVVAVNGPPPVATGRDVIPRPGPFNA